MRWRRRKRAQRLLEWLDELPASRRAALLLLPLGGLAALAFVGRRRVWKGVALVAEAVEEVADTVEDAAEDVRDAARARAEASAG
jgi:hypothetical protein